MVADGVKLSQTAPQTPTLRALIALKGYPPVLYKVAAKAGLDWDTGQAGGASSTGEETWHAEWLDGTYVDVSGSDSTGWHTSGTALRDLRPETPSASQPIYREGPDGRLYQIDPTTNQATPVPGMPEPSATPTVREFPDGSLRQWDPARNTWTVIGQAPVATGNPTVREFPDGSLRQWDAASNTWTVVGQAPASQPETISYGGRVYERQPDGSWKLALEIPQQAPYRSAMDIAQQQYEIERLRQQTIPPMSLLLDQQSQTIAMLAQKVAAGEITPQEADQYIQAIRANSAAAMRGTTPYQEEQARRAQRQNEQQLGWDIINQSANRAGSLASSFLSSAGSMAQSAMMPVGKMSLGVDPIAIAEAFAAKQNPAGLSDFARMLLMGTQGAGGISGLGAGAGATQPLTIDQVLAKYPGSRVVR